MTPLTLSFGNAPVVRVVLGLSFRPLPRFRTAHIGLFWERLRGLDIYTLSEDYPYRRPVIEEFGEGTASPDVEVSIEGRQEPPRVVFSSPDATRQVALQLDLIQVSWYRAEDQVYPHYDSVKERFFRTVEAWQAFVEELDLGSLQWSQGELSYSNALPLAQNEHDVATLRQLVRVIPESASTLGIEDLHYSQHVTLDNPSGQKARLHTYLWADVAKESPPTTLTLNLRGPLPPNSEHQDLHQFFDFAHDALLSSFLTVTTDRAHNLWGREQSQ